MISVIIPTYNCADYIQKSIDSLLDQDRARNVHIVVVDDGSTDHTEQIMEMYYDEIVYIKQPHANANVARNRGMEFALDTWDDRYFVFADADCYYGPTYLAELKHVLKYDHGNHPFVYCDFVFEGQIDKPHISGDFNMQRLMNGNFIDTSSAMIRRDSLIKFDPELKRLQDWDFFLGITRKNHKQPKYLRKMLYTNHVRKQSVTNTESYEEAREYIIKKHNL